MQLYDWLACVDPIGDADLIFALAGRHSRKVHALELFSLGRTPTLLLSVDRFEIRRFFLTAFADTVRPCAHSSFRFTPQEASICHVCRQEDGGG